MVCPDLRGFGKSFQPIDEKDSSGSSKRAKANDCVNLMKALGHDGFAVAGHVRGHGIDSGHHVAEDNAKALSNALLHFFSKTVNASSSIQMARLV